jgi:hypothetical protein
LDILFETETEFIKTETENFFWNLYPFLKIFGILQRKLKLKFFFGIYTTLFGIYTTPFQNFFKLKTETENPNTETEN